MTQLHEESIWKRRSESTSALALALVALLQYMLAMVAAHSGVQETFFARLPFLDLPHSSSMSCSGHWQGGWIGFARVLTAKSVVSPFVIRVEDSIDTMFTM
jgi:hypothetical protein